MNNRRLGLDLLRLNFYIDHELSFQSFIKLFIFVEEGSLEFFFAKTEDLNFFFELPNGTFKRLFFLLKNSWVSCLHKFGLYVSQLFALSGEFVLNAVKRQLSLLQLKL